MQEFIGFQVYGKNGISRREHIFQISGMQIVSINLHIWMANR